ncbi:phage/plasmid primase, P4 family [Rhizobium sp. SSA_523]|uniref:DNA primase family protein n=1 Tax=Rhizobium sp. SSA_523 TaxID=2952477 RepID=UPI0020902D06|nr:phage/plasmid primase, P4 family [Rhizobium sp. SSA_523]MCO5734112.1 phage/plasmid primase, P4 family [Rhizobium sp. SSA_523]WKC24749.1 phage/plasmid primase, P4 family [Rhizobium sp. SSA_523]
MTDPKKNGVPDEVARILQMAVEQRAVYSSNPDPLPVQPAREEEPDLELTADELLEECAALPETDIGNGERLRIRYGKFLRHVTHVGWHGYDGQRWMEDTSGAVVRKFAHRTAEFIDEEAIMLDCSDEEKAIIVAGRQAREDLKALGGKSKDWDAAKLAEFEKHTDLVKRMKDVEDARAGRMSARHSFAKSSCGSSKIDNMMRETVPYCSVEVKQLNTDLYAINTQTGTLRFFSSEAGAGKTGKWQVRVDRHDPRDLVSKLSEVMFDGNARCPLFDQFLKRVMPDVDYRRFLQRYMGYCLLGLTGEQCLLFFYGAGRNGKSTFVDLMVDILGDYAASMSIDSFAGEKRRSGAEATPDLARLPGVRLVAASEPEMGVHLKDALIKVLTGGEPIPVRHLNKDFFELIPQFKIILSGNHKPIIKDDSDGIWRRVHLVPWEIQIPEDEVDRDLPRKLRAERHGIFAWMVKGALDYLENGLGVPAGVRAATAEYREESDPIGAFIRNGCHVTGSDADRVTPEELFNAYMRFARREGLSEFRPNTFTRRLPDQCRKTWKGPDGLMHMFRKGKSGSTFYFGISIRDEFRGTTHGDAAPPSHHHEEWPDDIR